MQQSNLPKGGSCSEHQLIMVAYCLHVKPRNCTSCTGCSALSLVPGSRPCPAYGIWLSQWISRESSMGVASTHSMVNILRELFIWYVA